jgi:hypothetical protein
LTSRPMGWTTPLAASACSSKATAASTCCADSALGRLSRSTPSRATAARSAARCGVSSALTRTTMVLAEASSGADCSRSDTSSRAWPLRASGTESSRSKLNASASPASALANNSGRTPGTNSLLRIDHALHGAQCAGNGSKEKSSTAYSEETFHLLGGIRWTQVMAFGAGPQYASSSPRRRGPVPLLCCRCFDATDKNDGVSPAFAGMTTVGSATATASSRPAVLNAARRTRPRQGMR